MFLPCKGKDEREEKGPEGYTTGRTKAGKIVRYLCGTAVLSALGYVLMFLGKAIPFGPLSFLEVEPSDAIVVVAYSMYGFWSSFLVGLFKTLFNMATYGPVGSPIPIGQITALLSSILYSLGMLFCDRVLGWMDKGWKLRLASYASTILLVSSTMTLLNYLFITPTYLTFGTSFATYADVEKALEDPSSPMGQGFFAYFGSVSGVYGVAILGAYLPFNLVKGIFVFSLYEILFTHLIVVVKKLGWS